MNDFVFCEQCGERLSAQARFCKACGSEQPVALEVAEPPARTASDQAGPSRGSATATTPIDSFRIVASGHVVLGVGAIVLFFQYLSSSLHAGSVLDQLLVAIGYGIAASGWWAWSRAMSGLIRGNPQLQRPFQLLAAAYAVLAAGGAAEFFQLLADSASGGYVFGALVVTLGAGIIAFGFRSGAATAGQAELSEGVG